MRVRDRGNHSRGWSQPVLDWWPLSCTPTQGYGSSKQEVKNASDEDVDECDVKEEGSGKQG